MPKIISVSAGYSHALALADDGNVWAWGDNANGEIGNGSMGTGEVVTAPYKVNIENVVAISAGFQYSLALKGDGTVWAWGSNYHGVLGDGTTIDRPYPVQVGNLTNIVAIAANRNTNYALRSDGTVWAWGSNLDMVLDTDELGDGSSVTFTSVPVEVNISDVKSLGEHSSSAITNDGSLWAWGSNIIATNKTYYVNGSIIDDLDSAEIPVPVKISKAGSVEAISQNNDIIAMLRPDGTVWSWGDNTRGEIGDGSITPRGDFSMEYNNKTFVRVPVKANIDNVQEISAGGETVLALKNDGTVWLWGESNKLENGLSVVNDLSNPTQVNGLNNVVDISAGTDYYLAVKNDGTVWGWGNNNYDVLGDYPLVLTPLNTYVPQYFYSPIKIVGVLPDNGQSETVTATPTPTSTVTPSSSPVVGSTTPYPATQSPAVTPVPTQASGFGLVTMMAAFCLAFACIQVVRRRK